MEALDDFVKSARRFLDDARPRRAVLSGEWGVGSDTVALFTERSPEADAAEVAAAREWRRELFDAGYGWISGPEQYGGRDLPGTYDEAFAALEREYETPDSGHLRFGVEILAPTLLTEGSDYHKDRLLIGLRRADIVICQLFSEPGAGSDLANVATRATREGEEWVAQGQKVWSSGAQFSSMGMLIARTGAEPRHRGLSTFLIDLDVPGVEVRPIRQLTGGASFNEVFLDGVRFPDTALFGQLGAGWAVVTSCLIQERSAIGRVGADDVQFVQRLALLARRRGRLGEQQVRQRLAEAYAAGRARQLLIQRLTSAPHGPQLSMVKLALTNNLTRIVEIATELLGPDLVADSGEWGTYAWAELLLQLPGLRVGGGTDEILRNILAERVLGLPREAS